MLLLLLYIKFFFSFQRSHHHCKATERVPKPVHLVAGPCVSMKLFRPKRCSADCGQHGNYRRPLEDSNQKPLEDSNQGSGDSIRDYGEQNEGSSSYKRPLDNSNQNSGDYKRPLENSNEGSGSYKRPLDYSNERSSNYKRRLEYSNQNSGNYKRPLENSNQRSGDYKRPLDYSNQNSGSYNRPFVYSNKGSIHHRYKNRNGLQQAVEFSKNNHFMPSHPEISGYKNYNESFFKSHHSFIDNILLQKESIKSSETKLYGRINQKFYMANEPITSNGRKENDIVSPISDKVNPLHRHNSENTSPKHVPISDKVNTLHRHKNTSPKAKRFCCKPLKDTTLDVIFLCPLHSVPSYFTTQTLSAELLNYNSSSRSIDWNQSLEELIKDHRSISEIYDNEADPETNILSLDNLLRSKFSLESKSFSPYRQEEFRVIGNLLDKRGQQIFEEFKSYNYEKVVAKVQSVIKCSCDCDP